MKLPATSTGTTNDIEHSAMPFVLDEVPGFSILRILDTGNQSVVYLARQRVMNRLVAIKTVATEVPGSSAIVRLRREGQIAAKLELPNVVRLYDRFDVDDRSYSVFEYVDGGNLRQRMNEGNLLAKEAARLTMVIARTMDEVHRQGVLHLDLKPENILMTSLGEPKISDFGLAEVVGADSQFDSLSETTVKIEGTPWYMAPEQIEKNRYAILPTTDVYAIGVILYEMLSGRPPFLASDRNELFEQICRFPPLSPRQLNPRIPHDLETICLRCLVKNPAERYRSAGELADDLDRWLRSQPIRARKVGYTERLRLWRRRNPIVASLLLFSILTLCIASIAFLYNYASTFRALNLSSQHEQERQANLVQSLHTVDPKSLPFLIETFQASKETYAPFLIDAARQQNLSPFEEARFRLALMDEQTDFPGQFPRTLLETDVTEFESIVRVLEKSKGRCRPEAWKEYLVALQGNLEIDSGDLMDRFRAATALVHHGSSRDWKAEEYERIADGLLNTDPLQVLTFSELLSPIHDRLIAPLVDRFKDSKISNLQRRIAANLLAEYARRQPLVLSDLLLVSDRNHFATFLAPLMEYPEEAIGVMQREIETETSSADREERRIRIVRQSRAAVALMRLGHAEIVWPLLRTSKDPSLRSEIIHSVRHGGIRLAMLVERYSVESDLSVRRALLLAIGNFDVGELPEAIQSNFVNQLRSEYHSHHDSGLHAACSWLFKQWHVDVPVVSSSDATLQDAIDGHRNWFVNSQGQSFAVIRGPVDAWLGSPDDEPDREPLEVPWSLTVDRTFAIGMKEVTSEEFKRFMPNGGSPLNTEWGPDYPACRMNYFEAAQYCRWLSEQEGIAEDQMCYPPLPEIKEGFKANPNYLRRTGYRLPSEAEMELVMRAGATTRFGFGEWEELLGEYAWYVKNAYDNPRPTGLLKPNDFGLFDIHGNVCEWGQEWISHMGGDSNMKTGQRKYSVDIEDMTAIVNVGHYRVVRGGGYRHYSYFARCAQRDKQPVLTQIVDVGIRIARTLVHHPVENAK